MRRRGLIKVLSRVEDRNETRREQKYVRKKTIFLWTYDRKTRVYNIICGSLQEFMETVFTVRSHIPLNVYYCRKLRYLTRKYNKR